MPRSIRFHLDEHVAHAVADGLLRHGIDVTTTTDAGLLGAADIDQITFAVNDSRIIFTEDAGFLALAHAGIQHGGIVYCSQNTRSIDQVIRALQLIWEVYEPAEMQNRVEFI